MSQEKLTLNMREVARVLGLSKSSVFAAVHRGEIPHIRVGKRILIPKAALERMLSEAAKPRGERNGS
ncbi:MAG: helix-turn-helix domain-containing protein [Chloroflexi bacterium]|nr:helix-turn-helix domain-containing protein [Chloroflexota bacterium]